ncbi:MAG: hypothetical protein GY769_24790, partial [bacterium]|nr:hypothetical protein [bacterium]
MYHDKGFGLFERRDPESSEGSDAHFSHQRALELLRHDTASTELLRPGASTAWPGRIRSDAENRADAGPADRLAARDQQPMSPFQPGRNLVRVTGWRLRGLLVALALLPCNVQAQSTSSFDEVGRFYVQNFAPQDYGAHAQNWAIVQSPEGLLYVANGHGVLEYDGVSWRLIR